MEQVPITWEPTPRQAPPSITLQEFYERFGNQWRQGEHVEVIGPTGTGKTTIAHTILDFRTYVCVLAVKRNDDTLERFRNGVQYGRLSYKIITRWPPDYPYKRVILWVKPKSIVDKEEQAKRLYTALNAMFMAGGWCIYFDDAGLIAGQLGLAGALVVLLNMGRSSYLSVVVGMQRPASMVARVPREALNQPRHKLFFKYTDEDEITACSKIAGIPPRDMKRYMAMLRFRYARDGDKYSDFLYVYENDVCIVVNEGS